MKLKMKLDPGAYIPSRAHDSDAGLDLYAIEDKTIYPYGWKTYDRYGRTTNYECGVDFDTGVHVAIKPGYYGSVAGRSGLNFKNNIICPGGTIDSSFRGAIRVKLYNLGKEPYEVKKGDRIAQLIIKACEYPELDIVEELDDTERSDGGFGSTGV